MIARRQQALDKESAVKKVIQELLDNDCFISSAEVVVKACQQKGIEEVKIKYAQDQMHDMGLKYKKVKHISMQGNSEKSLVLRQRWALTFLGQDLKHKNVISVDETWLGMADMRK